MQRKCIILLAQNVSVVREILSCWNQWLYFYQLLSRVEVGGRVQKKKKPFYSRAKSIV